MYLCHLFRLFCNRRANRILQFCKKWKIVPLAADKIVFLVYKIIMTVANRLRSLLNMLFLCFFLSIGWFSIASQPSYVYCICMLVHIDLSYNDDNNKISTLLTCKNRYNVNEFVKMKKINKKEETWKTSLQR